jgi:hypothetical protein
LEETRRSLAITTYPGIIRTSIHDPGDGCHRDSHPQLLRVDKEILILRA